MVVYILRQINTEDKAYDATSVQAFSTRELALKAFDEYIEGWNSGVEPSDEYWLHPQVLRDELDTDGFAEAFNQSVIWHLDEYTLDSGDIL